jgi:hypothetical protein
LLGFSAVLLLFTQLGSSIEHTIATINTYPVLIRCWFTGLYLLFPLSLMLLSFNLTAQIKGAASSFTGFINALAILWAGLMTTSGCIALTAIDMATSQGDIETISLLFSLQNSVGGAVEMQGGLWTLLATHHLHKKQSLHWFVRLTGYTTGVAGIATLLPDSDVFQALFGITQLCWFFAVGVAALKASPEHDSCRHTVP